MKMKNKQNNITKALLLAFITTFIFSCNDAIDIDQPGRLEEDNAFQTVADLELGLLGAYNQLDITPEMSFSAAITDESTRGIENGGQNLPLLNFNVNESNSFASSIWGGSYAAIDLTNRIIQASSEIDSSEDPVGYGNVLGQAYAMRAYCFFRVLTFFSPDYTDNDALAGVLITSPNEDIFDSRARSTNGQFYAQIEADLNAAENLMSSDLGVYYMGTDFINALRARMYAYKGQWDLAEDYADAVLANYSISTANQYYNMFEYEGDQTEVIFALRRTVGDSYDGQGANEFGGGRAGNIFAFTSAAADGGAYMEMSRGAFNVLTPNDVRYERSLNVSEATIDPSYDGNSNYLNSDVLIINKFAGGGVQPLLNDLIIFRASEMLLIKAEAAADELRFMDVATIIKQLQDNRFNTPQPLQSFSNQEEAFGAILDERRKEFLFEGHRWVDLKRLGDLGDRGIDRDPWECSFFVSCSINNNDYRFTLPIPLSETIANDAIQQNPQY